MKLISKNEVNTKHPQPQHQLPPNVYQMEDPFYLHGSEQSSVLVAEKLTTTIYNDWRRAMTNALAAANKFGFVTGTLLMPDDSDPL
ncbi:unnamed protein product [Linum trigynum]|uniref:Retrotransposon Copia-like N-terminal domain-containing protein n=1 Tax=Linum trigynum TaxID=586398 RepID=A0AAV2ESM3_9ROSI